MEKTSEVRLETELRDGKAVLSDVFFTAPFKVMLPFYLREDFMQVMVLSASAGIMEGDVQKFDIHVNPGTSLEYLSQAYEKIHKMKEGMARRETRIVVEPDAYLKYAPLPTIPFKDSAFENHLEIELKEKLPGFCSRRSFPVEELPAVRRLPIVFTITMWQSEKREISFILTIPGMTRSSLK